MELLWSRSREQCSWSYRTGDYRHSCRAAQGARRVHSVSLGGLSAAVAPGAHRDDRRHQRRVARYALKRVANVQRTAGAAASRLDGHAVSSSPLAGEDAERYKRICTCTCTLLPNTTGSESCGPAVGVSPPRDGLRDQLLHPTLLTHLRVSHNKRDAQRRRPTTASPLRTRRSLTGLRASRVTSRQRRTTVGSAQVWSAKE